MNLNEKTIDSKLIYHGKIINFRVDKVILPNGNISTREIVEHPGAVAIVALNEKKEVLMVYQYRKATEKIMLEIPAGKLEKGEDISESAQRELMEETGYYAKNLKYITSFYTSPGFSNEYMHLFWGEDLIKEKLETDEDEFLKLCYIPIDEAIKKIKKGQIKDSKTITGLLLYYLNIKRSIAK